MFKRLKWWLKGKPMIHYTGYNCGCCGKRWAIPFDIPEYQSVGEWLDTWGCCPEGRGCNV